MNVVLVRLQLRAPIMRRSSNGLGKQTFNLCNAGSTPVRRTKTMDRWPRDRWHETFNLTAKAHRGFESHPVLQFT